MRKISKDLSQQGQSVWLDNLHRTLITSGELLQLIQEDGVVGLTSNPSIFEKAIAETNEYIDLLESAEFQGLNAKSLYEHIAVRDIQGAADILAPVYLESKRRDGYVSLEVSPVLAYETQATLEEARRLWQMVGRDNLMIKVPGTQEGIIAFQQLISEGINVNVTLLFSPDVYEEVAIAYLAGLEHFAQQGGELAKVGSVASFFISRIDTAVDQLITERLNIPQCQASQSKLISLLGKVGIASAKIAYRNYLGSIQGERWQRLQREGAQTQRLLWASTGTKNPNYSDVVYIEELIGKDTVNTMPPATLAAFLDHGRVRPTLTENLHQAIQTLEVLEEAGIPFKKLTGSLLTHGVHQFGHAFVKLLKATHRSMDGAALDTIDLVRIKLFQDLYNGGIHY